MKLNRLQLKSILKECVKELINEGAFNAVIKESFKGPVGNQQNNSVTNEGIWNSNGVRRPAANDLQSFNNNAPSQYPQQQQQQQSQTPQYDHNVGQMHPNARLQELARTVAQNSSGGNPKHAKMMESIFADTAMTTLQKQLGAGDGGGQGVYVGEEYTPEAEHADVMELQALGAASGHWANLAFGKYNK